jgi:hypothetical protein
MVNTKELRDLFDDLWKQAGKRASDAMSDVTIGRRSASPGLLWLGVGLVLGAAIGMVAAILASPYSGEQARAKITERVEKMRKQHEEAETNGHPVATPIGTYDQPLS